MQACCLSEQGDALPRALVCTLLPTPLLLVLLLLLLLLPQHPLPAAAIMVVCVPPETPAIQWGVQWTGRGPFQALEEPQGRQPARGCKSRLRLLVVLLLMGLVITMMIGRAVTLLLMVLAMWALLPELAVRGLEDMLVVEGGLVARGRVWLAAPPWPCLCPCFAPSLLLYCGRRLMLAPAGLQGSEACVADGA